MPVLKKLIVFLLCFSFSSLNAQVITTIAGNGTLGFSGDGGPGASAELRYPRVAKSDGFGNIYIADNGNYRIRKLDRFGNISTVAGNGVAGHSGDGGQATAASLRNIESLAIDINGNVIFIEDSFIGYSYLTQNWIRKIDNSGILTTIAGNGRYGYVGDGGPATAAEFVSPIDIAIDGENNIFIADNGTNSVRKINSSGIVTTVAGCGIRGGFWRGDTGIAADVYLEGPYGIAVDINSNLYIDDGADIKKVNAAGYLTIIAGNDSGAGGSMSDTAIAIYSYIYETSGIVADNQGNVFFSQNYSIKQINAAGLIFNIAGNDTVGYKGDGGPASAAEFKQAWGVSLDNSGNMYIADLGNNRIRKITYGTLGITTPPGIGQEDVQVRTWPMPNSGAFNISVTTQSEEPVKLQLSNMTGQTLQEIDGTTNRDIHVITELPTGIYFLTIIAGNSRKTTKIIIER